MFLYNRRVYYAPENGAHIFKLKPINIKKSKTCPMAVIKKMSTRAASKPSFAYLIEKKRDGNEFTEEEVRIIVDAILDGEIPDYQLAVKLLSKF